MKTVNIESTGDEQSPQLRVTVKEPLKDDIVYNNVGQKPILSKTAGGAAELNISDSVEGNQNIITTTYRNISIEGIALVEEADFNSKLDAIFVEAPEEESAPTVFTDGDTITGNGSEQDPLVSHAAPTTIDSLVTLGLLNYGEAETPSQFNEDHWGGTGWTYEEGIGEVSNGFRHISGIDGFSCDKLFEKDVLYRIEVYVEDWNPFYGLILKLGNNSISLNFSESNQKIVYGVFWTTGLLQILTGGGSNIKVTGVNVSKILNCAQTLKREAEYKDLVFNFQASGDGDPIAQVFHNDLGGTLTFVRQSLGTWLVGISDAVFVPTDFGKAQFQWNNVNALSENIEVVGDTVSSLKITSRDADGNLQDLITGASITFRNYK